MSALRGSAAHRVYSVVVFIVLASQGNVTISLVPPLYSPIARALGLQSQTGVVGVGTAVTVFVSAVAAVGWAYVGDRTNRKPVLMIGTVLWSAGTGLTAIASTYPVFFGAQMLAAVGLGAVASVGFSVVSDLISPRRRGLVMSLWGLSQAAGTLAGTIVAGALGSSDWRRPFQLMAVLGIVATLAYLFTYDIRRGQSEPELAAVFEAGEEYENRIGVRDVPKIFARRSNVWLVLQGVTAQVTFGSLVWLPYLFQKKAEAQGFDESTAIQVGSLLAVLFQLGGILSVVGGQLGDRLQRRDPGGRAKVAAVGILGGIPLYIVLFVMPLHIPRPGSGGVLIAVLKGLVTSPTLAIAFVCALLALALTSANSPNWFALNVDVNPPEHRGSVYAVGNLANGIGRSRGNSLVAAVFPALATRFPPPMTVAVGLAIFQVFFIPTGIMYWLASRTSPKDIDTVRELLRARAGQIEQAAVENRPARGADQEDQPVSPATLNERS